MKVKDLRKMLDDMPQEADVFVAQVDYDMGSVTDYIALGGIKEPDEDRMGGGNPYVTLWPADY